MIIDRREFIKSSAFLAAASLADPGTRKEQVLRVAVIGHTGRGNYGHGLDTLWLNYPGCEIAAVADPDAAGLEKARERLKGARGYRDYREMLKTERPDIVCVAPRHIDQHRDMVLAAVNAGAKGIYMEKPFCRDLKEADEIAEACRARGTKLALAHRNRYYPALAAAGDMVDSGQLGKVLEVRARGKEDHRGGALDLWVLGSHVLNLIPLFTGAFISCSASLQNDTKPVGREDLYEGDEGVGLIGGNRLHARFYTEKGIPVYFDSIKNAGVREGNFGFQILGTAGVLDIRIDTVPLVKFLPVNPFFPQSGRPEWIAVTSGGVGAEEPVTAIRTDIEGHHAAIRDLLNAVRTGAAPLCNEVEGRATVEAIMGAFESHRQRGAVVPFPLPVAENPLKYLD